MLNQRGPACAPYTQRHTTLLQKVYEETPTRVVPGIQSASCLLAHLIVLAVSGREGAVLTAA